MVKKSDVKITKRVIDGKEWINVIVEFNGRKLSFGLNDVNCQNTVLIYHDTTFTEITLGQGEEWRITKTDNEGHIYDIRHKDYTP